ASLLLKSNKTIAEAAFASGFNRLDYFSAAFKQKYKVSPSSFSKK
ncbi:helix-turn-helix domain-containing protein, partial [Acinetobacter baumannii]